MAVRPYPDMVKPKYGMISFTLLRPSSSLRPFRSFHLHAVKIFPVDVPHAVGPGPS